MSSPQDETSATQEASGDVTENTPVTPAEEDKEDKGQDIVKNNPDKSNPRADKEDEVNAFLDSINIGRGNINTSQPQSEEEQKGKKQKKAETEAKKMTLNQFAIKNANAAFLINTISPQLEQNEISRRTHKDFLVDTLKIFLLFQFATILLITAYSLFSIFQLHKNNNPLSQEIIQMILTFIGAYITAFVAELYVMLKHVVENVFDTSVVKLAKIALNLNGHDEND